MIANFIEHGFEIRAKILPQACTECPFYSYSVNDDSAMCGITGTEIKTDGAQDHKRASDCPIIKAQPTVNDWIPVSERLPEDGDAFVTFDGYTYACHDYKNINYHPSNLQIHKILTEDNVIAWKPIEPYTRGEE